ncbi:hypothetical protein AB4876_05190 [Zhongshania guokunii]|uniref:Uncharacterized protein n=1 Tax=Zhongshania guokunii TaxID=641783 RepID=A0ABV3U327_9GAMM
MLRSLLAMIVVLLCANALADRHHSAKSWLAGSVSDTAECRADFAGSEDPPAKLLNTNTPYTLLDFPDQPQVYAPQNLGAQCIYLNAPIRAPPKLL